MNIFKCNNLKLEIKIKQFFNFFIFIYIIYKTKHQISITKNAAITRYVYKIEDIP